MLFLLRRPAALRHGARCLSWYDSMGKQQARTEAESAMQLLLGGAPHFSSDPAAGALRAALDAVAPLANAAPPAGADAPPVVDAPPMALAQLLSARAFGAMRDRAAPHHGAVFELLQANAARMALPEGEGRPTVEEVGLAGQGDGSSGGGGGGGGGEHWPALAKQRWEALGEVRALSRTAATLQVIGSAGDGGGGGGGGGGGDGDWAAAAERLLSGPAHERAAAERLLCRDVEALPVAAGGADAGEAAAAEAAAASAFRKVLVQNYELAGVAAHDRFVCGPLGFLLQPYLLPRAVQAAQAMNLQANASLQRLQRLAARLAAPDGELCDARRPAGPLHPDGELAASEAEYCPDAMRVWAEQRYETVAAATAEFATLTALVAAELAETADKYSEPKLLGEALRLLALARPIFEMEAAGTERGDEGLAALEEAEARIRKEWVPS